MRAVKKQQARYRSRSVEGSKKATGYLTIVTKKSHLWKFNVTGHQKH